MQSWPAIFNFKKSGWASYGKRLAKICSIFKDFEDYRTEDWGLRTGDWVHGTEESSLRTASDEKAWSCPQPSLLHLQSSVCTLQVVQVWKPKKQQKTLHFFAGMLKTVVLLQKIDFWHIIANVAKISTYALWGQNVDIICWRGQAVSYATLGWAQCILDICHFFTLTHIEVWKFYTQKRVNLRQKRPRDKTA